MTRKEILNSSEYWQERAEIQCSIEHIDCTIQLVDKQQLIDKVCEWVNEQSFGGWIDEPTDEFIEELVKAMKGK